MSILNILVTILVAGMAIISIGFFLYMIVYLITKEVRYIKDKINYGKIEGKVISKYKEFTGRPYLYMHYIVIQKVKEDGAIVKRDLYVSDHEYQNIEIDDKIAKIKGRGIVKA